MGCPRRDNRRRCLLGILSRGMFCWKDKVKDRYIISCAEERELKKEGKEDAENVDGALRIKRICGEDNYYTDRIVVLMKKFQAIASEKYKEEYIEKLNNLNGNISNLIEKGKKVLTDDVENVRIMLAKSDKYVRTGEEAMANILRSKAEKCMLQCVKNSTDIDVEGARTENMAMNKLAEYNAYFSQELDFCLSKISTYWRWFRKTRLKIQSEQHKQCEDISLPDKDVLLTICDVKNPAEGFEVVKYIDVCDKVRAQKEKISEKM
jgi:hypothetical protein